MRVIDGVPVTVQVAWTADLDASPAMWEWDDVTEDLMEDPIPITRGRGDESSAASPGSATVVLRNQEGQYTPGMASSPYYPHVRQGVPIRVSIGHLPAGGYSTGSGANQTAPSVEASENALLLCLWATVNQGTWTLPDGMTAGEVLGPGPDLVSSQAAWEQVEAGPTGTRTAVRSANPPYSAASLLIHGDNGPPEVVAEFAEEATTADVEVEVEAEAGQWLIASWALRWDPFDEGYLVDGSEWVPLVNMPVTADQHIRAWARPVTTSGRQTIRFPIPPIAAGQTFLSSQARVHVIDGAALATSRFVGHVSEWRPEWPWGDTSRTGGSGEAQCVVTAAGITRRLAQGQGRVMPAYSWWARDAYREGQAAMSRRPPAAWWPLDDGPDARHQATPASGRHSLRFRSFGAVPTELASSPRPGEVELGPALGTGAVLRRGYMTAPVQMGATGTIVMDAIFRQDQLSEETAGFINFVMRGPGSGEEGDPYITWSIVIGPGDDPEADPATIGMTRTIREEDDSSTVNLADPIQIPELLSGEEAHHLRMRVVSAGSQAEWAWYLDGVEMQSGSITSVVQPVASVLIGGTAASIAVGQVALWDFPTSVTDAAAAAHGWPGERAVDRVRRVTREAGIPVQVVGEVEGSTRLGAQPLASVLEVLDEAGVADGGILYESTSGGLAYRPRRALYNQRPGIILDATDDEITEPFQPILDDQALRNDITVRRQDGGETQVVDADHIAAHGRYDDQPTLSLGSDAQLLEQAGWRLHLGTWPGMRYPAISPALTTHERLVAPWTAIGLGDRVDVTRLPGQHPVGEVPLLVQGYAETLSGNQWEMVANTSPAGPWEIGVTAPGDEEEFVPDAPDRVDTAGSELAAGVGAEDTLLDVVTTSGPRWITTSEHEALFPFDLRVGSEIVRATGIVDPDDDDELPMVGAGANTPDDEGEFDAPSVDAEDASMLVCVWQTFTSPGGTFDLPDDMTALGFTSGTWSVMLAATEEVGAGATGPRTIEHDTDTAWSAVTVAIAGDGATPVLEETTADMGAAADITVSTSASVETGWWLVAIHGWDWDISDEMTPPSGGGWLPVVESGGPSSVTSRTRVWAKPVIDGGVQSVTFGGIPETEDNHARILVVSGLPTGEEGTIGQAITVTRHIGGQPGPHPAGAPVRLAHPAIVAL